MPNPYTLMTPGPVPVPPEVLEVLALPMEHHRTPEFEAVFQRVLTRLKSVFETHEDVFMHTSTGSGGMESALVNTLSPGDKVIAIICGKFGERWAEMAHTYGANVVRINVEWGQSIAPDELERELKKHPDTKLILAQACETSTGILNPIRELAALTSKSDALFLVDGITALGAMPMPMDEWKIDALVGGSQKAFMLPTGLSFLSFSSRAWERIDKARCPRFYFDIRAEKKANQRGETLFSSNVPLVKGLDVVLERVARDGGMTNIHKRIASLSKATLTAINELGLQSYAKTPSPSLTAVALPSEIDGQKLREQIEKVYRIVVMGGQDKLKGKIIRIGHMGWIRDDDLLRTIEALGRGMIDLGSKTIDSARVVHALTAAEKVLKA